MNKELEFKDTKVIVRNEYGHKTEREISSNIEEILITENNIEEIEKLIDKENETITQSRSKMSFANTYMSLCFLWGFLCISNALTGNIFSSVCNFLCSAIWGGKAYFSDIRPHKRKIKTSKSSILLLEKELDLQNKKLNELQEEKNNNFNYVDTSKKKLTTSEKIIELNNKLIIIEDYQHNKAKYLKLYKAGILEGITVWYNSNNLKFIEELIKMDLKKNTKSKTKEKQKTLKK